VGWQLYASSLRQNNSAIYLVESFIRDGPALAAHAVMEEEEGE
jgi:hypothetical protein